MIRTQREYQECFVSLRHGGTKIPYSNVSIPMFQTMGAERDSRMSGEMKGRGVALFVNNIWCNLVV